MFKFFKLNLFFISFLILNSTVAMDIVSTFPQDVIEKSSEEIKEILSSSFEENKLKRTKSFNDFQQITNFDQKFNDLNRNYYDWYEKLKTEHMRRYYKRNREKDIFRRMR